MDRLKTYQARFVRMVENLERMEDEIKTHRLLVMVGTALVLFGLLVVILCAIKGNATSAILAACFTAISSHTRWQSKKEIKRLMSYMKSAIKAAHGLREEIAQMERAHGATSNNKTDKQHG